MAQRTSLGVTPIASIVIPTRDRLPLLRRLLESLSQQRTSHPFEVIVSVNDSQDGTIEFIKSEMTRVPLLRMVEVPQPGAARARNAGARLARGRILMLIDDDMWAEENVLESHLRIHETNPGCCVQGNVLSVPSRHPFERMMAYIYDGPRSTLDRREPTFEDIWPGHMSLPLSLFLELGGYDESFADLGSLAGGEGIDFGFRLLKAGVPVRFAEHAVTHHRFIARFGSTLRRCYANGLAYGRLMDRYHGFHITGVEPIRSPSVARTIEIICRMAAHSMEPLAYGHGTPPKPLAFVYSLGLRTAVGRGMHDASVRRTAIHAST